MRTTRRVRLLATFALAAVIFSQLASAAHFLWVNHVRCPEHGELLHAGSEGEQHLAAPARPGTPAVGADVHREERSHEVDHCTIPARLEQRALSAAPAAFELPNDANDARIVFLEIGTRSPIELLRRAPKSSPPSLA